MRKVPGELQNVHAEVNKTSKKRARDVKGATKIEEIGAFWL
jgi:hypothetical protein